MMRFETERDLTTKVLSDAPIWDALGYSEWRAWGALELEGLFGIPDLVLAFGRHDRTGRPMLRTCAFEMKLSDWKRAIAQAFRYQAFAQCSSVVMDEASVDSAIASIESFHRANIGLISVSISGGLRIHHRPLVRSPYAEHLKRRFITIASSNVFGARGEAQQLSSSWSEELKLAKCKLNRLLTHAPS
jgi:hypothetical protein